MAFGVKANTAIANGQWWRFVTPIFIHIGWLHLIFNSYAFGSSGPRWRNCTVGAFRHFLRRYRRGGSIRKLRFPPVFGSAGASGAIFGLFGVLLVFGIRYRSAIPPFFKRAVGTGVLTCYRYQSDYRFDHSGIDNSAHIGGLLAGAF